MTAALSLYSIDDIDDVITNLNTDQYNTIRIFGDTINDAHIRPILDHAEITSIHAEHSSISAWIVGASYNKFKSITYIDCPNIGNIIFDYISQHQYLHTLHVDQCNITSLEGLTNTLLPNMHTLSLHGAAINYRDLLFIPTSMPNLRTIDLSYTSISNVDALSSLKSLEEIILTGNMTPGLDISYIEDMLPDTIIIQ